MRLLTFIRFLENANNVKGAILCKNAIFETRPKTVSNPG